MLKGAGVPGLSNAGAVSITGGTITGTNASSNLFSIGIPFVMAPTGTMGNNGAVTLGTALDATYSDGVYMLFPAGAIAAGIPAAAAWYWTVMSSATVGTVYNSTYTSGLPAAGVTTAFSTTGPGAFTGVTAATDSISITLPANSMGPNGRIECQWQTESTNNANAKLMTFKFGGTSFMALSVASSQGAYFANFVQNRNATNRQVASMQGGTSTGWGVLGVINSGRGTVDTTANVALVMNITRGVATDVLILSAASCNVIFR